MKLGVLALQGGIVEHVHMLRRAAERLGVSAEVIEVRKPSHVEGLRALVIPGGESTAMYRLGKRTGVAEPLREAILEGLPTLGTCAGAALLAKEVEDRQSGRKYEPLLAVADFKVVRNYFGRQRESFEAELEVKGIGKFRGVFIRAPVIVPRSDSVAVLSEYKGEPVMVKQGNVIATAFHPELTSNTKIHEMLIEMAR
ncbi:MAG: pyridoxal 5'-phosphate synthase glutaminase subunit PdxT [Crenarchaeota archaeon]|nr:pyridoxal 5'-phosphate synthase glutaminase subunit PdxT [Thermoproteota archaeon]